MIKIGQELKIPDLEYKHFRAFYLDLQNQKRMHVELQDAASKHRDHTGSWPDDYAEGILTVQYRDYQIGQIILHDVTVSELRIKASDEFSIIDGHVVPSYVTLSLRYYGRN